MELSDDLLCLFSGRIERRDGTYVIEVPTSELEAGTVGSEETYRIGVFPPAPTTTQPPGDTEGDTEVSAPDPPVEEGEVREVEIEDVGDQGDGITRVERGFVIIVPDADPGERVKIRVTTVRDTVAFGEVIERSEYFH